MSQMLLSSVWKSKSSQGLELSSAAQILPMPVFVRLMSWVVFTFLKDWFKGKEEYATLCGLKNVNYLLSVLFLKNECDPWPPWVLLLVLPHIGFLSAHTPVTLLSFGFCICQFPFPRTAFPQLSAWLVPLLRPGVCTASFLTWPPLFERHPCPHLPALRVLFCGVFLCR